MDARTWSVGEPARMTGLTVRTLHHYDELGLLATAETVRLRLERVEEELARGRELRERLRRLLAALEGPGEPSTDDLIEVGERGRRDGVARHGRPRADGLRGAGAGG